jgi:hypothetical protein
MSSCAIMQPTYLPWAGYFNLIASVDYFVLLDDVQFESRSWQHRNRILLNGAEHMISVPTRKMPREDAVLSRVQTSPDQDFRAQHWKVLQHAYSKAMHGCAMLDVLESAFLAEGSGRLVDFTVGVIASICKALGITTPLLWASEMKCGGRRSDHLAEICRHLGCTTYLSPRGSADYLEADAFVQRHGIALQLQAFEPAPYQQYRSSQFVSHLSVVDVIANMGIGSTRNYIGGRP